MGLRKRALLTVATAATLGLPVVASSVSAPATGATAVPSDLLAVARAGAPVVLTGAQIPAWAAPAAEGVAAPYPSGASSSNPIGDHARDAHNGTLVVPPAAATVDKTRPDQIAAYSWVAGHWKEIPVQVDQRFPYFLANGRSNFGVYSGTDEELTYAWNSDAHDVGEEAWKKMFGDCQSRFADNVDEVNAAVKAGWLSLGPQETAADYLSSMTDPQPLFDTDDELSFMAGDAGGQPPSPVALPPGAQPQGQVVTLLDPVNPTVKRYVYLFHKPGGSSFSAANSQVQMGRDGDSTQWIDKNSFSDGSYDQIGTSNTGYGPNLPGTVCSTAAGNADKIAAADGTPRPSSDRQPRDDFTVSTPVYQLHATGRWLVQGLRVRAPGASDYGPNIIARWKGRAFQQSPDSSVSVVGFEDEQVNWELNSALLGWRSGPVRAIREVWGADSGTNVTKTEYYYNDADVFAYHVRVHPIPPDGLYTDWDYRPGVATRYYNIRQQAGVPIDGVPDSSVGEIDQVPVTGQNAEINSCDPTFDVCSAMNNPEEVAGNGFGLVYQFELTGATAAAGNVAAVPYYRDDACFDDGTGDAPAPRPWPGEKSSDTRVQQGYVDYWAARGMPVTGDLATDYAQLKCQPQKAGDPNTPPWQVMPFQGAIGEHGVHFFVTQDSDNAFGPKNVDEIDGQQWRFEVPMATPKNVMLAYGLNVSAKLVPVVARFVN